VKWLADRVGEIVWTLGFVAIMAGVVAALWVQRLIDDDTQYGYAFLVLALLGSGIGLMGVGLLLAVHGRPPRRRP
jgi:hypothetical protein